MLDGASIEVCPAWCLATVQIVGLCAAALVRLSAGSRQHGAFRWLFLVLLLLAGVATLASTGLGATWFLGSGMNLAAMVLTSVWDPGQAGSSLPTSFS